MDPIRNPYSPGAGTPPPELAGRDPIREKLRICFERLKIGNPAKSIIIVGLRGVGKTVLLDQIKADAETGGAYAVRVEAQEGQSLPALLAPALRTALIRLSHLENAKHVAQRALQALAGFAKLKVKYHDVEVGLDLSSIAGLADNGDLGADLTALLVSVGEAAKAAGTVLILFIDELQYIKQDQFGALIGALHRCAQLKLPVTIVGAGLPQLLSLSGEAKSYSERLFDYPVIDKLDAQAAKEAITKPAAHLGVTFEADALDQVVLQTHGYPYFLQEWGKHIWDLAVASPITRLDVERASQITIASLDESFFKVRLDRTTPSEKRYLRAMAELGAGPHRSGDIALRLGAKAQALGPVRSSLIRKGIVWSPIHGDTTFTVPLFHEYLLRRLPSNSV